MSQNGWVYGLPIFFNMFNRDGNTQTIGQSRPNPNIRLKSFHPLCIVLEICCCLKQIGHMHSWQTRSYNIFFRFTKSANECETKHRKFRPRLCFFPNDLFAGGCHLAARCRAGVPDPGEGKAIFQNAFYLNPCLMVYGDDNMDSH